MNIYYVYISKLERKKPYNKPLSQYLHLWTFKTPIFIGILSVFCCIVPHFQFLDTCQSNALNFLACN